MGRYEPLGGWVTKDAASVAPIATFRLEVPAPGQEAAQEPAGAGGGGHDCSQESTARTSSPI